MFPNPAFPVSSGLAAEVVFKRWGLLTARGNATLLPVGRVPWMNRIAT